MAPSLRQRTQCRSRFCTTAVMLWHRAGDLLCDNHTSRDGRRSGQGEPPLLSPMVHRPGLAKQRAPPPRNEPEDPEE
jgi:hypothetical protein